RDSFGAAPGVAQAAVVVGLLAVGARAGGQLGQEGRQAGARVLRRRRGVEHGVHVGAGRDGRDGGGRPVGGDQRGVAGGLGGVAQPGQRGQRGRGGGGDARLDGGLVLRLRGGSAAAFVDGRVRIGVLAQVRQVGRVDPDGDGQRRLAGGCELVRQR